MQSEFLQRLQKAQQVAHSAGTLALDYFAKRDELTVSSKGLQDRVTQADREVERHIFQEITEAFPGDGFLGEEMASAEPVKLVEEGTWVVDPIDDTDCLSMEFHVGVFQLRGCRRAKSKLESFMIHYTTKCMQLPSGTARN